VKPKAGEMKTQALSAVHFGKEICNDLAAAEAREWLVTNGLGGFASGTVAGSFTRRYHGLLVAALQPPVGRMLLVGALDEVVKYKGQEFQLGTHHWASGVVAPDGYARIREFRLDGTTAVWTYAIGEALLEKRIWMKQGENTTYVQYTLRGGKESADLELKALVNYRDFHSVTHGGNWRMKIEPVAHGVRVTAYDGATPFYMRSLGADCDPLHIWYRDCAFPLERERGLEDREDQLLAANFRAQLEADVSLTVVLSASEKTSLDGDAARAARTAQNKAILSAWDGMNRNATTQDPIWIRQLALAADQFIVKRPLPEEPNGNSIIAGYHWFGDWGRDTMIALPGLTLSTGRPEVARQIVLAFARYVDGGMLPNNFPDAGGRPEYNTIDAALWYFEAVRQYVAATDDTQTLQKLFPVLAGMVEAHVQGTRYNIHVDPSDGLLYGGGPGVQLTWMDAKIGDWVVTPRTGKPVEINALWINALASMAGFARRLGVPGERYEQMGAAAQASFGKFWNAERNCCFDVIDSPGIGSDASLRPNQIFAVSLPVSPLSAEQQKAVVDICAAHLLTPVGLRSLGPGERGYARHYGGGPRERDAVYHQGTVWAWLQGPFALAHYRVYRDKKTAVGFLESLGTTMDTYGIGTLPEIFDGDAPHKACGCIAQAWSVGEVLRAWRGLGEG
jgi:predicted glycogen debranching enzyme